MKNSLTQFTKGSLDSRLLHLHTWEKRHTQGVGDFHKGTVCTNQVWSIKCPRRLQMCFLTICECAACGHLTMMTLVPSLCYVIITTAN